VLAIEVWRADRMTFVQGRQMNLRARRFSASCPSPRGFFRSHTSLVDDNGRLSARFIWRVVFANETIPISNDIPRSIGR
jgi:hypothetical protein